MKNIVYLNITDAYPFKFTANNAKDELIGRSLIENGDSVTVINNPFGSSNIPELKSGTSEYGLEYYVYPKSELKILSHMLHVIKTLIKKKQKAGNYLFLINEYFPIFLLYVFIGRIIGYKTVVVITEWHRYFENVKLLRRINYYIFDALYGYITHASLPISDVIIEKIKHFGKPMLKVPILSDYQEITPVTYDSSKPQYYLYCGSLGYFNVIELLVNAFEISLQAVSDIKLVLVVSGPDHYKRKLLSILHEKGLTDKVIIKQQIPYSELIDLYCNALALLIPLRTQQQDTARFPHKIGEYIATGRPIITGKVGEVGNWFVDGVNAYIADDYTAEAYAKQMITVSSDGDKASAIGKNGRKLGVENFDYRIYGTKISDFLQSL